MAETETTKERLEAVKKQIMALQAKTVENGCSEAEALAAAKKVGQLLEKYDLSMDEVTVRQEKCVLKQWMPGTKRKTPVHYVQSAVGRFTDTRVWYTDRAGPSGETVYSFYGLEPDAVAAVHLMGLLRAAIHQEAVKYYESGQYGGKRAMDSFKTGMVDRLQQRLRELRAERDANVARLGRNALVVVKSALVEEEFAKLGMRLKYAKVPVKNIVADAYSKGRAAANNVSLAGNQLGRRGEY